MPGFGRICPPLAYKLPDHGTAAGRGCLPRGARRIPPDRPPMHPRHSQLHGSGGLRRCLGCSLPLKIRTVRRWYAQVVWCRGSSAIAGIEMIDWLFLRGGQKGESDGKRFRCICALIRRQHSCFPGQARSRRKMGERRARRVSKRGDDGGKLWSGKRGGRTGDPKRVNAS